MFKVLCCLALLAPSTALSMVKRDTSDAQPKSASPEGVELLWQRPKGEVKGVFLYLHGCHGRATGMWTSDGPDGFHFDVCDTTKKKKCMGYVEEILLRQKARKRGYVVAAVSGGVGSPRGCMNTNDVPRIQLAVKHLVEVAEPDLKDKPVIMLGHSSGGRVLPELVTTGASIKNAKCIVPVADEIRVKGDSAAKLGLTPGFPEDVSTFFVHMHDDKEREGNVRQNLKQVQDRGVRVGDLKLRPRPITPELFMAEGYGLKNETAQKLYKVLKEYKMEDQGAMLLSSEGMLMKNPYGGGDNWNTVLKLEKNKELLQEIGGFTVAQQYMDVAWCEHWMAGGRYLDSILRFCEQPGNARVHEVGKETIDLVQKVRAVNAKADEWKKAMESKNLKKNHGAQMKLKGPEKKEHQGNKAAKGKGNQQKKK